MSTSLGKKDRHTPRRDPLTQAAPTRNRLSYGTPKVSVIVSTLNDSANLPIVFGMLPAGLHEVIIVGRCSTDNTLELARNVRPDVKIVLQDRPGEGWALAAGFAAATGDILVVLDGDGSADPTEIERYIQALTEGADFAKGSRFLPGGGSNDIPPIRRLSNAVLCAISNHWFDTSCSDLCCGYSAFWTHCLPAIDVGCADAEVEILINIQIANADLKVAEVPSFEFDHRHRESNRTAIKHDFRVLRTIVKERFVSDRRRRPDPSRSPH